MVGEGGEDLNLYYFVFQVDCLVLNYNCKFASLWMP